MKYIKLFEEKWEQPDRTEELLDFTNDYWLILQMMVLNSRSTPVILHLMFMK